VEVTLTPARALQAVEEAFRALARDEVLQPLRTLLTLPGGDRQFLVMPGHVRRPPALGAKLLTLFPGNHVRGLPSHQGVILLFHPGTGALQAVVDAEPVTALRTAAASALATRLLAREDAVEMAILGSGVQARSHLRALLAVRPIRRVRIWSRTRSHAEAFAAEAQAWIEAGGADAAGAGGEGARQVGARRGEGARREGDHREPFGGKRLREVEIALFPDPEAAVRGAGVVCTVTASPTPVLRGEWLAPGAHVNAVGAYTSRTRELDSRAVQQARFFVDLRESALSEAGDFLIPREEGLVADSHILGEIGELLEGRVEGRTSDQDRTVFKSLGLAAQDLAAVAALVRGVEGAVDQTG
jgi:alanine dehydrogenase